MNYYRRQCLSCNNDKQEIVRTLRNGNIVIRCRCGKQEEISQTGYSVPHSQEVKR